MNETPSSASRLIEVFNAAAELPRGEARRQYLDEACGGDRALRAEVEQLLGAGEAGAEFLKTAAHDSVGDNTIVSPALSEQPGEHLGAYKLLEKIGEGGFGTVWVAEQERPLRRRVALKVLKPGMDSRQVLARFEAERQALALMDHPNIATVHDGGVTATGRPFFVMELVKGVPITEFCDQRQLPPRARLELFLQVCQAVQHAHQKGIIHRDLKPSNILVAMHDTRPVVKVIDFGIAKALGQELTDRTMFTGFAQFLGTPLYMSPEQAGQSSLDVDTRSDIYSLGVLLYELLTGTTPIDRARFKQAAEDEIRRIIREEEPPRPSTRLSESKDSLPSISALRHTEPAKLTKLVRGELDWIVMKALEKDRSRRYETASGFAMDVQRYLANEPVTACPPSTGYRFKKFVRRNKRPVLAAAAVLLTLIGGIAGTTIGLLRAEEARRAEAERAEGERRAKQYAEARESETRAVLDFVEQRIFVAARPEGETGGLGRDVTLRRALEAALPFVNHELAGQPLIEARLRLTMAQSFRHLGEAKVALEQAEAARALYVKHRGPEHIDALSSALVTGTCYEDLGREEEALRLREDTLAVAKASLGADHFQTLRSMNSLATSYAHAGRHADAIGLDEEALTLFKATLGVHHRVILRSMSNLASSYELAGRDSDALTLREETLRLQKSKLGADHPDTIESMNNLASSYRNHGRIAEAAGIFEELLPLLKARLGPGHIQTIASAGNAAVSRDDMGRHTEALQLHEEALALAKAELGPDHSRTLLIMANLARCYHRLQRYEDGLKMTEEVLSARKSRLGPDHPETLAAMHNLGTAYRFAGRQADALRLRESTREMMQAKHGPNHSMTLWSMHNLAISFADFGRHEEALRLREETLALATANLRPDDPLTLWAMHNVGLSYIDHGRHAEACEIMERTVTLSNARLGADHPDTVRFMKKLSQCCDTPGRSGDAGKLRGEPAAPESGEPGPEHAASSVPSEVQPSPPVSTPGASAPSKTDIKMLEDNLESASTSKGIHAPETIAAMIELAAAYVADGSTRKAIKLGEEALTIARTELPAGDPRITAVMKVLVTAYHSVDLTSEAQKLEAEIEGIGRK